MIKISIVLLVIGISSACWADEYRTHFGHPDLQGIWTNATLTTLERPDDFETLVLNEEEAVRYRDGRQARWQDYEDAERDETGQLARGAEVGAYNTFWMDEGNALAVLDGEIRSSIIVHPEDGSIPYTWAGRWRQIKHGLQYLRYDGPELRPLGERCVVGFGSTGGPPMLPVLYNNNYQIVQNRDHVLIYVEMNHDVRTVRLNSAHPPAHVKKWLGDSIGWWQGDTLVVETTNFHPDQGFRASTKHLLYSSENLKVTERFSRVDEGHIKYEFAMHDPATYRQVWRGEIPMRKSNDAIYEYACHEGNYAMQGILAGARVLEEEGEGGGFMQTLAYWLAD